MNRLVMMQRMVIRKWYIHFHQVGLMVLLVVVVVLVLMVVVVVVVAAAAAAAAVVVVVAVVVEVVVKPPHLKRQSNKQTFWNGTDILFVTNRVDYLKEKE